MKGGENYEHEESCECYDCSLMIIVPMISSTYADVDILGNKAGGIIQPEYVSISEFYDYFSINGSGKANIVSALQAKDEN